MDRYIYTKKALLHQYGPVEQHVKSIGNKDAAKVQTDTQTNNKIHPTISSGTATSILDAVNNIILIQLCSKVIPPPLTSTTPPVTGSSRELVEGRNQQRNPRIAVIAVIGGTAYHYDQLSKHTLLPSLPKTFSKLSVCLGV